MNFSCIFLLALALFGAVSQAYIGGVGTGVGLAGGIGYGTECGAGYGGYGAGAGYGAGIGYGGAYEGGYGCRTACGSTGVCDTCQCMKTIVRPTHVERIPYSCQRRVHSAACRTDCGLYGGGVYNGAGVGGVYGGAGIGGIGTGYGKGYLY